MSFEPWWIPEQAVLQFHEDQKKYGGLEGIKDQGALESALTRPKVLNYYETPSLFELAARYGVGIGNNHPFVDANKRTAYMVMYAFLGYNGYELDVPKASVVNTMVQVIEGDITEDKLVAWLEQNSYEIRECSSDQSGET